MFDLYVHGTALKIFFNLWDEAVKSKASSITESLWSFLSILVFPSSTLTFSGSEVVFFLNNFFPSFAWVGLAVFQKFGGNISKIMFWLNLIVFIHCFSTKIDAWDRKRPF